MEFLGEHLLPGKLGHFFVVLSFASSLVAVIAYFKATNANDPAEADGWRKMGRKAFILDVIGVYACLATIIYIISTHKFEYNFAWEHSGRSMPFCQGPKWRLPRPCRPRSPRFAWTHSPIRS